MKRLIAVLLVAMLLTGSCAAAQENSCALWRVKKGDVTVYLLGSIHIGNPDMYPFSQTVLDAIKQSDEFVFECDTTSGDAFIATQTAMVYTDGTKLRDVIGQDLYDKAIQAFEAAKLPAVVIDAYKPWTVTNLLTLNVSALQLGTENVSESMAYGVETQLHDMLKDDGRAVSYLEETMDQLSVLDGFSLDLQRFLLEDVCNIILNPEYAQDSPIRLWADWWKTGDIESFANSYLEGCIVPGHEAVCEEYHRELITKRNENMARSIAGRLEAGGKRTYFVVAGLLHLSLPSDSIISVLEQMEYKIERIQ